jgi:hypothetical protein
VLSSMYASRDFVAHASACSVEIRLDVALFSACRQESRHGTLNRAPQNDGMPSSVPMRPC